MNQNAITCHIYQNIHVKNSFFILSKFIHMQPKYTVKLKKSIIFIAATQSKNQIRKGVGYKMLIIKIFN